LFFGFTQLTPLNLLNSEQNPEVCDATKGQSGNESWSHKNQNSNFKLSMLTQPIRKTFDIGDGRQVTIETGRLARQADGAVTVTIGNCILLGNCCC
jgi:polyribonucleotide nucleotidyltransferase